MTSTRTWFDWVLIAGASAGTLAIVGMMWLSAEKKGAELEASKIALARWSGALAVEERSDPVERARIGWLSIEIARCVGRRSYPSISREDQRISEARCAGESLDTVALQSSRLARAMAGEVVQAALPLPEQWAGSARDLIALRSDEAGLVGIP